MDPITEAARAALPPMQGEMLVPGLSRPVEVLRDRWGVPHIYADSLNDLFLAQGYVIASERLFQIELLWRLGSGRLSEVFGEPALPLDRFVRTVGWNRAAEQQAARWDRRSLAVAGAFGAGIRAWIGAMPAPPPEYALLGLRPMVPPEGGEAVLGAAAGVFLAWTLSRNWDHELLRAEIAERLGPETMRTLFPDLDTEAAAIEAAKEGGFDRVALLRNAVLPASGQGSNSWVVDGSRTETGKPLLANDPHLAVSVPSAWFECHLVGPGIDVAGVTLPFSPGILIGHNDRIAWGFTNTEGDVQDVYLERLSEDSTMAEHRGRWEPVTIHREEIAVRGRDQPEVMEVRETRHGPVIDAYLIGVGDPEVVPGLRHTCSLRWVGAEHGIEPSTIFAMNTAGSWEDFRAAVHDAWRCPGQNMVYADVDGNVGYQLTGLYPIRRRGDGTVPVPGWTDQYEWEGWIPYDDLPRALNPEDGFLCTANNKVHDEGYPYVISRDFLPPYRARRIAELVTERERHTRETFGAMQTDTRSLPAAAIVPHLVAVEPAGERQKQAIRLLEEWDLDLGADSAAAALYEVWCHHIALVVLGRILGDETLLAHLYGRRQWTNAFQYQVLPNLLRFPTARWFGRNGVEARDDVLREALDATLDELTAVLGEDMGAWRWGALHRARFRGRLALASPDLFTAGEVEMGGDEQTVLQSMFEPGASYDVVVTASWRQILDLSDWDASVGIHAPGQSGNPASPHWADLLPLWAEGMHHPMPFSRLAVEEAAEATLRLLPGR
ncbi:MAG TPA: penicillin acylase family protein [Actinomycetota bacterium]|nr:penicillin acylase family protein [Actinomycetota bacterium]